MVSCTIRPMLCPTITTIIIIITTLLQYPPPISGASTAESDDNNYPPYHDCGGDVAYSYTAGSEFEQTLNDTLYTQLTAGGAAAFRTFANLTNNIITSGTLIDRVYALYFCRGDIDASTCQNCVNDAVQEITHKCKFKKQGIVWYEFCTLRYANYSIFDLNEENLHRTYYNGTSLVSEHNLGPHRQLFSSTMNEVVIAAAADDNATAS